MKGNIYVTDTKNFAGVIEEVGGIRKMRLLAPDYYSTELKKFKVGEEVTCFISSRRPKRSDAQNRYYWGVYLPAIAKETGENNLESLHTLFKGLFLTTGIVDVLGKKVRLTKSTTDLSKNDFTEYIMKIEAETGVQAPPVDY